MKAWLTTTAGRAMAALAIVTLLAGLLTLDRCQAARTAHTAAKLATGQADAAVQSGADAVNTVGNRMSADAAIDTITQENRDAITKADGASAPVAAPVRDAGLRSLCGRAAYRGNPRCVQHADPR
ncbi:MAG: hypothetical protein JWL96_772 [Sphingomonas bacterium]|uniref:hypothetical protein n=1 Tax=Sphingomonas bacterium TaxID=1895847 RepID=UPI0026130E38|nr:hypothetical protein [Sphingomonas bacterium]MDB5708702.1 hypothetical protein [Sphingomonas bacterium]